MSSKYEKGTKLLVKLTEGEIYEGIFYYGDDSKISLTDVAEYPLGVKDKSIQHFYKLEIASITVIEAETKAEIVNDETHDDSIKEKKFEKLKELSKNFVYLSIVDNVYFSTIEKLKTCLEIAIWGFGSSMGRHGKIEVFAVATNTNIYLFDVRLSKGNRAFEMGLKEILENEDILKIVHNSKTLADCLFHGNKVCLENVFDTQLVDFMLIKRETDEEPKEMRKFSECVVQYLKIPANIISNTEYTHKPYLKRPLTDGAKEQAALQVAYLYSLKDIMQTLMFKNYHKGVNSYMNCMKDATPTESRSFLTNSVPAEILKLNLTI